MDGNPLTSCSSRPSWFLVLHERPVPGAMAGLSSRDRSAMNRMPCHGSDSAYAASFCSIEYEDEHKYDCW